MLFSTKVKSRLHGLENKIIADIMRCFRKHFRYQWIIKNLFPGGWMKLRVSQLNKVPMRLKRGQKKNPIKIHCSYFANANATRLWAPHPSVYPTQLQPAADSFSTLCQRWELSRKAMSSWWVGLQQGVWCHSSPGASWGSTPLCSSLARVRSWLDVMRGHAPPQYLNRTVSSES